MYRCADKYPIECPNCQHRGGKRSDVNKAAIVLGWPLHGALTDVVGTCGDVQVNMTEKNCFSEKCKA